MVAVEKGARFNLLVALATAFAVFALNWLFRFPSLNPETWGDVAAATGLRPPAVLTGGLIRGVLAPLFALLPTSAAFVAVRFLGWVSSGLIAFLSYLVLRNACGGWDSRLGLTWRGLQVTSTAFAVAAAVITLSDVVWYATQSLSATGLQIVLALSATWALQHFTVCRRRRFAFASMLVWTVLAVDVPIASLGVAAVAVTVFVTVRRGGDDKTSALLSNRLVRMTIRRFLLLICVVTALVMIVLECTWFKNPCFGFDGIPPTPGWIDADAFLRFFPMWARGAVYAASWKAWVLIALVIVGPFVLTRVFRDRSLNDEEFMPTSLIAVHVLLGVIVWSQLCGIRGLWFLNWLGDTAVRCPLLVATAVFLAALTLLWNVMVLGASVFLKRPRRIARYRASDDAQEPEGAWAVAVLERVRRQAQPVAIAVPAVIVTVLIATRYGRTLHGMLETIDDCLEETVHECRGATRIFTDGALDAGLELKAYEHGRRLFCVALMSGNDARDRALRTRGLTASEDLKSSILNAADLLRTWANDTPERLADAAIQLGFELWRGKTDQPTPLGLVALPPGFANPPGDVDDCRARGREFCRRVIDLYGHGNPDVQTPVFVRSCFTKSFWRLSRLAHLRADAAGHDGWCDAAEEEQRLADRLLELCRPYQEMLRIRDRMAESQKALLTPREGLKLALDRADFKLARQFAETIVASTPDDPHANFAIGMDYFFSDDWPRAELYLKRVLAQRPDDPTVLNNLAVIELKLYRYDLAEMHALKAQSILPDSPSIKRTLDSVRKARETALGGRQP